MKLRAFCGIYRQTDVEKCTLPMKLGICCGWYKIQNRETWVDQRWKFNKELSG